MTRTTEPAKPGAARPLRRRDLLRLGAAASAALLPLPAFARPIMTGEKTLRLYNLHTGERIATPFWADGSYVPASLAQINFLLRDQHTGEVKDIDLGLIDLLHRLQTKVGARQGLDVVCGYRSPETNALLVAEGKTHAANSFHIRGKAVDLRVPGLRLSHLRQAALDLHGGGVGYYPQHDFIHVDVGPLRHWEAGGGHARHGHHGHHAHRTRSHLRG